MPSAPVVSEADPVLQQSPVLEEFVDDVFSSPASSQTLLSTDDENTPLLKSHSRRDRSKPWYRRPSPKLLVPFALASALCRGITLAPRVEVFTQIACDQLRIEPATEFRSSLGPKSIARTEPILPSIQSPLWSMASSGDHVHVSPAAHARHNTTRTSPRKPTCRVDPEVQQGAAKLQMVIMTLTGALSALTSGFWGQFGDRHGRSCVIALSIFAMLATDIVFVLAASQSANPAFSFLTASRILVLSPLVEGALGGFPTMQAALNAYISDATPTGTSRAKIFARFFGIIFIGVAAGPTLGSVLPYDPFRISITIGVVNLILVVLLLPESLTKEQRDALIASRAPAEDQKPEPERGVVRRITGHIVGTIKGAFEPMAILLPKKRTGQGQAVSGKDWSLTYLSISLALYLLTIAIYSVKFLYAEHVFGWNTKELSYYLSFMGTLRALNLIVILPYIIKIYKPKSSKRSSSACSASYTSPAISPHGSIAVIGSPTTHERTMSLPPVPTPSSPTTSETPQPISATHAQMIKRSVRLAREQQFDLRVARISMFMDFLSYFLLCSSNSATAFVMTTTLSAFGGGTSPAMQSLALGILGHGQAQADVGRLFGALSMLSSIASTILSPMIFGSIYSLTVAVFPKAIFIVATAVLTTALALLALVQPTQPLRKRDLEDFPPRGRSRRSKDLRRTYTG